MKPAIEYLLRGLRSLKEGKITSYDGMSPQELVAVTQKVTKDHRIKDLSKAIDALEGVRLAPEKNIIIPKGEETLVSYLNALKQISEPKSQEAVSSYSEPIRSYISEGSPLPPPPSGPGLGTTVAKEVGTRLAAKGVGAVAKRALAGKIGAAIGSIIPGVGTVVGHIAGELATKLLPLVRRNFGKILAFLGTALLIFGTPFLKILGLAMLVGGLAIMLGGFGALAAQAATTAGTALTAIAGATLGAIAVPLIIALIATPIIIALILFIINSGAYLVPPSKIIIAGQVVSPYIDITKAANPPGPFENGQVPQAITYTVTVKAKKGALTNISFQNTCQVVKDGPPPPCTVPTPSETPSIISPNQPFTFTYDQNLSSRDFDDTFVNDTFTITADVEEQKGATAATTATVKIGNPPEECPNGWPVAAGSITRGAYSVSTHKSAEALDIALGTGNPVTARHSGTAHVFNFSDGYGKHVVIQSTCAGRSFVSLYGHLSTVQAQQGSFITTGQTIGKVGSSGNSSGPHVHYEFRVGNVGSTTPANYPDTPPYMRTPYIPKDVPRGCTTNCGSVP